MSNDKEEPKNLKKIAVDLYNNKIFCDRHLSEENHHMIPSIFLPIMLGAFSEMTPEDMREKIGFIYEYIDQAGPRGINGFPCFFSLKILSPEETIEMFKYFEEYKKLMENFAGKEQDNS